MKTTCIEINSLPLEVNYTDILDQITIESILYQGVDITLLLDTLSYMWKKHYGGNDWSYDVFFDEVHNKIIEIERE